jgi:hypothetical protein
MATCYLHLLSTTAHSNAYIRIWSHLCKDHSMLNLCSTIIKLEAGAKWSFIIIFHKSLVEFLKASHATKTMVSDNTDFNILISSHHAFNHIPLLEPTSLERKDFKWLQSPACNLATENAKA